MSFSHGAKRRRLDDAAKSLRKPFVSPLKTPKADHAPPATEKNGVTRSPYQPSALAHTVEVGTSSTSPKSTAATPSGFIPADCTPTRKQNLVRPFTGRTNPAEQAARKTNATLEARIRAARNELDTLQQATRIASSSTDADLADLAAKWRQVSQAAAEELFGPVKERVCRMGGVAAWRESERQRHDRSRGMGDFAPKQGDGDGDDDDDADCEFDSQGEELPEEEQTWRKAEKRRVRAEMREAADMDGGVGAEEDGNGNGSAKVWLESGDEDDTFTMDMMLRSLNIELDVIGYDKTAQRWIT